MENSHNLNVNFGTDSLEQRRLINEMSFLYKLFNNKIDCSGLLTNFGIQVPIAQTRNHYNFFYYKKPRTNILKKSPSWRMSVTFNKINKISYDLDINVQNIRNYQKNIKDILLYFII